MTPIGYLKTGVIHCDDNLRVLSEMPSECVDLVYLDPPFFSNRNYEVIWGDEAEVRSFEDRWEGGINVYIKWMKDRILELHRVLKPSGSIYLHCDWHASHYLKVMMDGVFGSNNFLNEIVWHYRTFHGVLKRPFARKHDVLLVYAKGNDYTFNPQFDTNVGDTIDGKRWRKYLVDGDKIVASNMPTQDSRFMRYHKRFVAEHGRDPVGEEIVLTIRGQQLDDVWPIKAVDPKSAERIGYPTQKPEALLERVITASTSEGDIVLDPFCGCGTAVAVAHRLRRQWIGLDISPTAVEIMRQRMEKQGAKVDMIGLPVTLDDLRELRPFEFQNWVIQRVHGVHSPKKSGDMGIDGFSFMEHLPIQVKQSERVGRNVIDNFETAVERNDSHKGYVIAFSFTRGAREEAARARAKSGMDIELVEVATLLEAADHATPDMLKLFPKLPQSFLGLPLPEARPKRNRPSVDELVLSNRAPTLV